MSNPVPEFFEEPGWVGAFTRHQDPAGLPNGTRIVKANSEPGDGTPNGTAGIVLGSFSNPKVMDGMVLYFVEWSNRPRVAVGCIAYKVTRFSQC